jgi:hypothetical protein
MGGNGILMDDEGFNQQDDGKRETGMNIQPMINDDAAEYQALDGVSEGLYSIGTLITLIQFFLTLVLA